MVECKGLYLEQGFKHDIQYFYDNGFGDRFEKIYDNAVEDLSYHNDAGAVIWLATDDSCTDFDETVCLVMAIGFDGDCIMNAWYAAFDADEGYPEIPGSWEHQVSHVEGKEHLGEFLDAVEAELWRIGK